MKCTITCPQCETLFTLFETGTLAPNKCVKLSMDVMCPICASKFSVTVKVDKGEKSVNFIPEDDGEESLTIE